jgi:hypothetical protein
MGNETKRQGREYQFGWGKWGDDFMDTQEVDEKWLC